MCSRGGRSLEANGTSREGSKTDLERSPPPGFSERENMAMKPQLCAVKYNFKFNILYKRLLYEIKHYFII